MEDSSDPLNVLPTITPSDFCTSNKQCYGSDRCCKQNFYIRVDSSRSVYYYSAYTQACTDSCPDDGINTPIVIMSVLMVTFCCVCCICLYAAARTKERKARIREAKRLH